MDIGINVLITEITDNVKLDNSRYISKFLHGCDGNPSSEGIGKCYGEYGTKIAYDIRRQKAINFKAKYASSIPPTTQ